VTRAAVDGPDEDHGAVRQMTTDRTGPADAYGERLSIVIVPRQRWSLAERSLAAVLATVPPGAQLIYVDGGSPAHVSANLERMVREADGVWLRRDCVLMGNEARNLAMAHVDRELVLFVDNDVHPSPCWIEPLVDRADATGAAAVGPLILHGSSESSDVVHIAGGQVLVENGVLTLNTRDHALERLGAIRDTVTAGPSTQLEFHALLLRRSFLDRIGPFDEELRSMGDHEDVMLAAARLGLETWFEPSSLLTYLTMIPLADDEIGYWRLRWSDRFTDGSLDHFARRWQVDPARGWPAHARQWAAAERTRWMHGRTWLHSSAGRALRKLMWTPVVAKPARTLEDRLIGRRRVGRELQRRRSVLGHE
jgi:GT2 family glycosyltransferase